MVARIWVWVGVELDRIAIEFARGEGADARVALEVGGVEVAVARVRFLHDRHALALERGQPGGGATALLVAEEDVARSTEVVVSERAVEPVDCDRLAVRARADEARVGLGLLSRCRGTQEHLHERHDLGVALEDRSEEGVHVRSVSLEVAHAARLAENLRVSGRELTGPEVHDAVGHAQQMAITVERSV